MIRITRIQEDAKAVLGVMEDTDDPGFRLYTLEPPRRDEKPHCVPAATYDIIPYTSPKHGETGCLHNPSVGVYAGMSGYERPADKPEAQNYIEIHIGNFPKDSDGCILIGERMAPHMKNGYLDEVLDSRDAVTKFREQFGRDGKLLGGLKLQINELRD